MTTVNGRASNTSVSTRDRVKWKKTHFDQEKWDSKECQKNDMVWRFRIKNSGAICKKQCMKFLGVKGTVLASPS
ncbi:hypothetical protein PoB_006169500 [Plakobranchus ocellatus]|uniref:Uncharacterized protein n=1 Tax=Plakobranchus ocellatus TaxID=259542 RepID=A0AAV4CTG2_9GAST|nr:hypothetical protein PoB_006169500 [Plakobranchus ocellatus]